MSAIKLTDGQEEAYGAFIAFCCDPLETELVISGFAGTGKSTLVNKLLEDLPSTLRTANLINQTNIDWKIQLTATTNKACEALRDLTGGNFEVQTIQSWLGLRVTKDYKTGVTGLAPHNGAEIKEGYILLVDEASFADNTLLDFIEAWTDKCKIVYIGDPAQLTPVKSNVTPAFNRGITEARLTEVVRQAEGNPIQDMATMFREVVTGKPWGKININGNEIQHMPRDQFDAAVLKEFDRPDWHHNDSKFLAWTNKTVIKYNHGIRNSVQGSPELQVGDYATCNQHFQQKRNTIKTDQMVQITAIRPATQEKVDGWEVIIDNRVSAFLPADITLKAQAMKHYQKQDRLDRVAAIDMGWIDLRAAYACTINKSQGSTYDKVFIDLDDLSKCHNGNLVARLLYVAVTRARHQVIFTGDF